MQEALSNLFRNACPALMYTAPQLHYFDRDLPVFEEVLASFQVTD